MKNFILLLLLGTSVSFAATISDLEKAIYDSNLEQAEEIINQLSISPLDHYRLLDLAQRIRERSHQIEIKELERIRGLLSVPTDPTPPSLIPLALIIYGGALGSFICWTDYFGPSSWQTKGSIIPALVSTIITAGITAYTIIRTYKRVKQYRKEVKQMWERLDTNYDNAVKIKQLLYQARIEQA